MHRKAAQVLKQVFVPFFVLLLALFAQALVRTNVIAAPAPPAARTVAPSAGSAARQTVRRIKPAPAPAVRIIVLDGVTYPWTDAGFSAALAAAGANGTVVLPQDALVTLTTDHMITDDDLTIRCEPGGAFVSGVDQTNLITITGTDDELLGCEFAGGAYSHSNPIFLWNSKGARVEGDIASDFVGVSTAFVYLVGASSSIVQGNQCTVAAGGASCIFGEKDSVGTLVKDNELDESRGGTDAHAITFHSTNPGMSVSSTQILDNSMVGGLGFCVEIGAFGGEPVDGFVISGNNCKMGAGGLGGYSVGSAATFWTVSNNTFDANGYVPSISCLEVAGATDGVLLGNSCNGGNISLSNIQARRVIITSNVIFNFHPNANAAIYMGTAVTSGEMTDNVVVSNLIHLPPGVATIGIWQQCLAYNSVCSNNSYYYNTIVSDGTPGTVGIKFENDNGTSSNESLGPNTFRTPYQSVVEKGTINFAPGAAPSSAMAAQSRMTQDHASAPAALR
jgi:hypothetical protein